MKTAFVTGATGFIGSNLVRALLRRGRKVRALARPASDRSSLADLDVEFAQGDLLDASTLEKAMRGCDEVYEEFKASFSRC